MVSFQGEKSAATEVRYVMIYYFVFQIGDLFVNTVATALYSSLKYAIFDVHPKCDGIYLRLLSA